MTAIAGVYEIRNTFNGNFYIGSSINLSKRLREHKGALNANRHRNAYLQRSWNKYGEDGFSFRTLLYCDPENTLLYEQMCLDNLFPEYNIAIDVKSGMAGRKHTEETRHKLSEANIGKHPSEATLANMSERMIGNTNTLGYKHTAEALALMSAAHKGKPGHMLGKHHTAATCALISAGNKGKIVSEATREKISAAQQGELNHNWGKHPSEETRVKLSGRVVSAEAQRNMSEAAKRAWAKRRGEA